MRWDLLMAIWLVPAPLLGQGGICIVLKESTPCPESSSDRRQKSLELIDSQGKSGQSRMDRRLHKGRSSFGLDAHFTRDRSVVNLPVEIPLGGWLGVETIASVIKDGEESGMGHSVLAGTLTFTPTKIFGAHLSLGGRLPTGGPDVVDDQKGVYPYGALTLMGDGKGLRVLISGSYLKRPARQEEDFGDTSTFFLGMDLPWFSLLRGYGSVFQSYRRPDVVGQESLYNSIEIWDLSLGLLVNAFFGVRLGVTIPLLTDSGVLDHEDREGTLDVGTRFNI